MSKRLLKRLSSCFNRRSVRNFRGSARAAGLEAMQVLEVRQLLTAPTLDTL